MDERRRLILLRHAKAAWPDVPDERRPLAPRGERDAAAAGRVLRDLDLTPSQVLCSTATRTRQTWLLAAAELDQPPEARHTGRIYQAGVGDLLALLRETPDSTRRLLVVGHNPGMQGLALTLADGLLASPALSTRGPRARGGAGVATGANSAALRRARAGFPTASLAVLDFVGGWRDLGPGTADLVELITARG